MNPLVPGAQDSAGSWRLPFPISSITATDEQRAVADLLLPSGLGLTSELGEGLPALAGPRGPGACWGVQGHLQGTSWTVHLSQDKQKLGLACDGGLTCCIAGVAGCQPRG